MKIIPQIPGRFVKIIALIYKTGKEILQIIVPQSPYTTSRRFYFEYYKSLEYEYTDLG